MKNKLFFGFALVLGISLLTFNACKKKDDKAEEPAAVTTPDGQSGVDNNNVEGENNSIMNEINEIISGSRASGKSASPSETSGICGFLTDSTKITQDTVILNFNGQTCLNRTRTGTVRLTWATGTLWKNANATIKIEYINYKVLKASDQKFVLLNGTQYLTNISGGTWFSLFSVPNTTLVTTITGTNLQVGFEDGKTAVYNINRRVTYTLPNSVLTIMAEGIGTSGSLTNLSNFGTTRNNEAFTSQVITPVIWNFTCGGAVLQGNVNLKVPSKLFDLTFLYGVDVNGNPVTVGPNQCPFGWKLQWSLNGNINSKVFGY